jgi:formylglycine-generating enzyme required for sulfatase activity
MGAPEDEPERFPNEGPRHKVRLNQGFWLADTACSQALWRAVMGNNPSRFQDDPQNPVESVSWDEAQVFLGRLQAWLPGVKLSLPSEAEWEYACRAGSDSPFNFGDTISPDLANYDGNYTYGDGREGEYRLKTVPVKSFAPNAWGLWQMHGNVWEWRADGRRDYGPGPAMDPRGPEGHAPRVVRGGSWDDWPRRLRSAYRFQRHRGDRNGFLGLRFSLRYTRPAGGAECPGE